MNARVASTLSSTALAAGSRAVRMIALVWLTAHGGCLLLCAQELAAELRWKNGDVLPGSLKESRGEQVTWSAPQFLDDLTTSTEPLKSVVFSNTPAPPAGAFRVATTSGDLFTADLVGSDERSFLFSSNRLGEVRVERDALYSLSRLANPNLVFDGSQFTNWNLASAGPIKKLQFEVFPRVPHDQRKWFPDFSKLQPTKQGSLASGYIDTRLSGIREFFAMTFEGLFEIEQSGEHVFQVNADDRVRLFVDGKLLATRKDGDGMTDRSEVNLREGPHTLQLHFIDFGGEAFADVTMTAPGGKRLALSGQNSDAGWQGGPSGHPRATRQRAGLLGTLEFPTGYELDLELTATTSPRFLLAFGADRQRAQAKSALRLETWDNELVVVQDQVFEPVLTIGKEQRDVRLRLVFDGDNGELLILDASGRALTTVKGLQVPTGNSGIYLRNRGDNLTVRRANVYRRSREVAEQPFDPTKPRVHLLDGRVVYGQLHVSDGAASVVDQDQKRQDIDLAKMDRVADPVPKVLATRPATALRYADGEVVRGGLEQTSAEQVILRTDFSEKPVACRLAGATTLGFPSSAREPATARDGDQLISFAGRLRGKLSFDHPNSLLSWTPAGTATPLRLSLRAKARVERDGEALHPLETLIDDDLVASALHLQNGEIIPCRIVSYDETSLHLESPFLKERQVAATHVKAIEFRVARPSQAIGSGKLERALTVPRFNRDNPPSHLLVANNGDLKRGSLLGITEQLVRFDSKLREITVPLDRLSKVVRIGGPEPREDDEGQDAPPASKGSVRATLTDGSTLIFEPVKAKDGKLIGRSAIYGEVAVPTRIISELAFGGFEHENFRSASESWLTKAAQEPDYGDGE